MVAATIHPPRRSVSKQFCWTAILVLLLLVSAHGQSSYPTDGSTPLGLKPGGPAGSYTLGGFDNINLYNGNLDFRIPLLSMGGRGGAGHTIMLPIEQHWQVETATVQADDYTVTHYYPSNEWWQIGSPGYGPGVMHVRYGVWLTRMCHTPPNNGISRAWWTLTRLTFTAADGTEYELRDQTYGGAKTQVAVCATSGLNRGKVFVTADGTAATFISDSDIVDPYVSDGSSWTDQDVSGYLMLRDGTRYRIDGGQVTWLRDRNGNKVSFTYGGYGVSAITDSLNRQVTIAYNVAEGGQYGTCDKLTFKGFGGASRVVRVCKTNLGSVLRSDYSLQSDAQLFPGLEGSSYGYFDPTVISAVWLPDNDSVVRKYQLRYNSYGEVARVELPTGGAIEYDHAAGMSDSTDVGGVVGNGPYQIYRRVVERREYADGSNLTNKMTYSRPESGNITNLGYVIVDQLNATPALLGRSKHYFTGTGAADSLFSQTPVKYPAWNDGKEYKSEVFDTNGTTILRKTEHTWQGNGTMGSLTVNARIVETDTTLEPSSASLVSKQTFAHDQYNNQTDVYEYDYGSGSPGSLVRHTATSYVTTNNSYDYACDPSSTCGATASISNVIHLRSLPSQVLVYDSGGTLSGGTSYEYDNYASDTTHASLVDRSSISGLDSGFTTSYTKRGNSTSTTRYLITSGSLPNCASSPSQCFSAYAQYDIAGNMVKVIDARGYATSLYFTDNFGAPNGEAENNTAPTELSTPGQASYAFLTKVTNALNQSTFCQYDYYLGQPVDGEDMNGIVASGYYDDALDRPTKILKAANQSNSLKSQTVFAYDDANRIITTTSDLTSWTDGALVSKTLFDNLGRSIETRQYEGGTNYLAVQTQYDVLGRAYKKSNPFRPWQSESAVWTTLAFDALGRTVTATTPDSAVVTTSYSGNTVTATDQAGKVRRSVSDALGRLTRVDEPNSSGNLDSGGSPVQSTSYTYNVLNNLTGVSQGSQSRTFVYDTLKRLMAATNPELGTSPTNGTEYYVYDANGNLLVKTDARSVSTHISYDELNRPTRRWYNGSNDTSSTTNNNPSTGVAATDEVAYFYDSQTLPSGAPSFTRGYSTGALVAVTYGAGSAGTYHGYDELGRVVRQYQQTDSVNYLIEAGYSVGMLTSETYPSVPGASDRRSVSYSPDSAGRLSSLSSSATSYAPAASVASIGYASHSGLTTETYGNSLIHAVSYNNRLQPNEIKLGTSGNPTSVIDLTYSYGTTNNNGNVQSVTYAGGGLSYTQSFSYDSLNRLATATETTGSTTNWSQTNGYDRYANRWIDLGGGSQNLAFSTSTNRITTSGYTYDSSGNLVNDGVHAYGFDADSKIKTVDSTTTYVYDGEGHRVKKLVGENTRFIYGIGGQLVAEYDGSSGNLKKEYVYGGGTLVTIEPTAVNSNGTQYATADNLSSPRVITNASGSVVSRHDYKPFGEEIGSGTGGRTTGMGFSTSGDNNRKKFTGYERDTETGLDFAQARYYASTQGRFTSPDPLAASAKTTDPQTWNHYAYCGNNPAVFSDPSGMSRGPAGMYSSIHDADKPPGSRGNNTLLDEAAEEWERSLSETREAIAEADSINQALQNGRITEEGAAERAAANPMLSPQKTEEQGRDIPAEIEKQKQDAITNIGYHLTKEIADALKDNNQSGQNLAVITCWAAVESSLDPNAIGYQGERGLFQLKVSTATTIEPKVTVKQLYDPVTNTRIATTVLGNLVSQYGDLRTALIVYKMGRGNYLKYGETQNSTVYADGIIGCSTSAWSVPSKR